MTQGRQNASLIELLADGEWWRGPVLAEKLGVTRAAVSSRVATLRELGLDVYSLSGKGYRLARPLDLLSAPVIEADMEPSVRDALDELIVREQVDSTNSVLAGFNDDATRACLAEYQSAGRGRSGRAWVSPFAANIYLSVARTVSAPRGPLGALSLAVGVALADALAALGVPHIGLKWPNDLWIGRSKVGGILIEHRGETGGGAHLIVGVGLNVAMNRAQSSAIDQSFTQLSEHLSAFVSRSRLAAICLNAVMGALVEFESAGFAAFARRWAVYDRVCDQPVRVIESRGECCGVARGINDDGSLRIEIDGLGRAVYSGDVSLRLDHSPGFA
ncbi:MAG: biotin--[acetyl-CoA-carboxylase] ligase [Bacteroidetes bacterium]|nr:biotin--[acetyl-CoA-carboxylase] ligase [Bacteroidota bacterium]